jgi:hypothetical protein
MITLGLDYAWYPEQRHQEMLAEAERFHPVQEALKTARPSPHKPSKILVYMGKKLAAFGASLEARYSAKPQTKIQVNQDTNPCS